ncbi:MAG TPA: ATP-binding protein [Puia sp.]|nr:ATP-binding protein [Puia sp.]
MESIQKGFSKKGVPRYYDSMDLYGLRTTRDLSRFLQGLNANLAAAKSTGDFGRLRGGYYKLSSIDSMRGNYRGAYENYKLYSLYRDSLQKRETEQKELRAKMQFEFDKRQAVARAEQEKREAEERRTKNIQEFTIAGLAILLVVIFLIAFIQWRNSQQRKRANERLHEQKIKVESALTDLKATQLQLIQSEKMASLGELTAGIAHEIQNPLNFVNNFSDVNRELLTELRIEVEKGNVAEAKAIASDVIDNEEKINYHGRRADAIVKGMLQHSRTTAGAKEPTDINALADEFLQLAFHGYRAKDKEFNVKMETNFDKGLEKVNVIPEDIGRVLLNLYNNAFYAVREKRKTIEGSYAPVIKVSTRRSNKQVSITVFDNGAGISPQIVEKIFQPFFTTKPAGQGTGLGLSLSYDIVKAQGGEIKVQSKEGEFTEFTVLLPDA